MFVWITWEESIGYELGWPLLSPLYCSSTNLIWSY